MIRAIPSLALVVLILAGSSHALADDSAGRTPSRPNIVYIMADDHAVNAVSCYGGRLAKVAPTPNLDRLAAEGVRLTNCYATNSICVPSRASILTGLYSHKNGVYTLGDKIDPKRENVAKLLGKAGYATAMIGKWHLSTDPSGFDHWEILPGQGSYRGPTLYTAKGRRKYEGHSTDVITDLSLDWLKQQKPSDKPFFLMCHFKAPHEPWDNADRYDDYLADVEIPEPPTLFEDLSHRSPGSREYGFTLETLAKRFEGKGYHSDGPVDFTGLDETARRKKVYQVFLKRYLRTIKGVDDNVGRLMKYLDESGLKDNTLVIYTSDQGYFLGEHDYIDKRWFYEESAKMPFIARLPGSIPAGTVRDELVTNVDFAELFLDYAGVEIPEQMQGRSFRPVLTGNPPADWRDAFYYRYWMHGPRPAHYGIRTDRFKLIFFYGLPLGMTGAGKQPTKVGWELYDLKNDPLEQHNIYTDTNFADEIKRLKERLLELKQELDDTDEKYPELMKVRQQHWEKGPQ